MRSIRWNAVARGVARLTFALLGLHIALPPAITAQSTASDVGMAVLPDVEAWREDIEFMASALKVRHANLTHSVSEEHFDLEIRELIQRLGRTSSAVSRCVPHTTIARRP